MARPQRVSEAEILEAARATFLELGARAPLAAIAVKLGISSAALLHRTGSKGALLARSLAPPLTGVLATLRAGPRPGQAHTQLRGLLLELSDFLSRQLPNLVVLRFSGVAMKSPEPPPTVALRAGLSAWLMRLHTAVSAEVTAEALLGALEARAFNRYLGGESFAPGDDAEYLDTLLDAFLPAEIP